MEIYFRNKINLFLKLRKNEKNVIQLEKAYDIYIFF